MNYSDTNANLNSYTNDSDEDLIKKIKSGDNEALNFLLNSLLLIKDLGVTIIILIKC